MANAIYVTLILLLSGVSIYFISYGYLKEWLLFGLGIIGALFSAYLIYRFNYPDFRVGLHLILVALLSYLWIKKMKKDLTERV